MEEKTTELNDQTLDDKTLNNVSGGLPGISIYKCTNPRCSFTSRTQISKCPNCSSSVEKHTIRKHFH